MRESWTDERLDAFRDEVTARFDAVDKRFDGVDKRFDRLETRFEAFDARFASLQRTMLQIFGALLGSVIVIGGGIIAALL